jgi:hypothetical protein
LIHVGRKSLYTFFVGFTKVETVLIGFENLPEIQWCSSSIAFPFQSVVIVHVRVLIIG